MSERVAYVAFLTVVTIGLAALAVTLAAVAWFLFRENRRARTDASGRSPREPGE